MGPRPWQAAYRDHLVSHHWVGSIAFSVGPALTFWTLDNSGRPPDFDQLRNRIAARAGSQPLVTGGEIADGRVDGEILSQPRRGNNFNATAYVVAVRFRADGLYSQPISAVPTVISQDVSFDPRC